MNVNIKSYVGRLGQVNLLDTIVEAVANSLHANAKNIEVNLILQRMTDDSDWISSVSIVDDGDGFHIDNQESFNTFMSEYKLKLGCRGIGRFAYLKVFSMVSYHSTYCDHDTYNDVDFKFSYKFDKDEYKVSPSSARKTGTLVSLSAVNEKFNTKQQLCHTIQDVKKYLLQKLIVEFSLQDDFTIIVHDGKQKDCAIMKSELPKLEQHKFSITQNQSSDQLFQEPLKTEFVVQYTFGHGFDVQSFFCTERRTVKETGIKINLNGEDGGLFLVSSNYMDSHVNDLRTSYDIPKDSVITLHDIEQELGKNLSEIILKEFPDIAEMNQSAIEDVAQRYPYLRNYISATSSVGAVDKKDVIGKALKSQRKAKDSNIAEYEHLVTRYHKMLSDHNIEPAFVDKFVKHIELTTEINKENLVEFVWYSDTILDFLIDICKNKLGDEELLHNLIIKKGESYYTSDDIIQTERNNMWVFGSQFMGYNFIASDKKLNSILSSLNKEMFASIFSSDKKPDVLLVMPTSETEEISELVLFELKKIESLYFDKTKGINQLGTYATALTKNISTVTIIWGYLVVVIDDAFAEYLHEEGYQKSYSEHGKTYVKYNEQRKLLLTVLDMSTLLSLAKARNSIFTNILSCNAEH